MSDKLFTDTEITLKCVDENEVLYDDNEEFIRRLDASTIECSDTLYEELLKNVNVCQEILLMNVKQRIILNESRVRFNPKLDVAGLEEMISKKDISKDMKKFLMKLSVSGYKCLKKEKLLDDLIELDTERETNVVAFGKKNKMAGYVDILTLIDESVCHSVIKSKYGRKKSASKMRDKDRSDKIKVKSESVESDSGMSENTGEDIETLLEDDDDTESVSELSASVMGRAAISVVLTARNYISASDIYKQILFSYLHKLSRYYILVFHVGPLVESQEMVLYEFVPPKDILKLVKSFKPTNNTVHKPNKDLIGSSNDNFFVSQTVHKSNSLQSSDQSESRTGSHDLNVSQLEEMFRKTTGKRLQKVADLKEYFKYLVHDCPGVKDNEKDKKDRYERYMAKKVKKKEIKRQRKLENEMESAYGSMDGEAGSDDILNKYPIETYVFMEKKSDEINDSC